MAAFSREFYVESEDILLNIVQNIEGDVSCVVWDAALVLSAYLDSENKRNKNFLKGKNVLELGSGVGCVGLTAACLGYASFSLFFIFLFIITIITNKCMNNK